MERKRGRRSMVRFGVLLALICALLSPGLVGTVALASGGGPSITSVTITGTSDINGYVQNPTITLTGSGFNPAPAATSVSYTGFTGQNYGTALHFSDTNNNPFAWNAGYENLPTEHDLIGLANLSYSDTQISYTFGTVYPAYYGIYQLNVGDHFNAYVRNVWCSGTVVIGTPIPCGNLTLNPSVTPNPVALNGSATASAGATDTLSGIASQGCDPVDTSIAGSSTVNCWATNNAGNYVTAPANYTVNGPCAAGSYSATGYEPCTPADAGYFVNQTGATAETPCAVGYYQSATGQTSCLAAPAGKYVDTIGAVSAISCAVGTYQPNSGSSSCSLADPGYFVEFSGSASETACPAGTYQPAAGASSCIPAEAGHFVATSGSTTETACAVGYYQDQTGQTSCVACTSRQVRRSPLARSRRRRVQWAPTNRIQGRHRASMLRWTPMSTSRVPWRRYPAMSASTSHW